MVELFIPENEDYCPEYAAVDPQFKKQVTPANYPVLRSFSASFFGQIVKVWYILKVFVKHDAWNEWGEGHVIEFPIKIFPKPTEIVGM